MDPAAFAKYAVYFDTCRVRRNELSYEGVEVVSETELEEVLRNVPEFQLAVEEWLAKNHPVLG